MNTYCPKHSISPHRKNRRPWTRRRRTRSRMLTRCTPWWTRWRWSTWCAPWRRPQPFPGPRTGGGRRGVGPRWRTRGQQCCPTRTTPYWACTALPPCPTTSCCRLGLLYTSSLGRTGEAERERWGGGGWGWFLFWWLHHLPLSSNRLPFQPLSCQSRSSGKSTYLRTVGICVVLAQVGQ